ncbi:MAG: RRXRR domain-containing protein [Elusimicrobiota bacterium]
MLSDKLDKKIKEFLPTIRLGVDFGEHAGGIALVQGNQILHAETFVDFHETTLETRRMLRRGRRSRHAKKMRIARLRSWILRQKAPAGKGYIVKGKGKWEPGGDRLPDPYWVMAQPLYQTKPGLYKIIGADPLKASTWPEHAMQGKCDAAGFVCALTHIFQKRGYKYDDEDLSKYSDSRLKEFWVISVSSG